MNRFSKALTALLLAAVAAGPAWADPEPRFSRLVVFGDSVSDPGNVFAFTGMQVTPPYSSINPVTRIPGFPYATGGHHFSNGATWVELLARDLGLDRQAKPAQMVNGATNFAFGGARACPSANPFDLTEQIDLFLASGGAAQLGDSLVVIFVGGNDVRDDLEAGGTGAFIGCAVLTLLEQVQRLALAGADRFLVANVANVGATPALRAIGEPAITGATILSSLFNAFLDPQLAGLAAFLGIQVERFDVAGALANAIAGDDFAVVDQACITPLVPPYRCANANRYLFWDGIHPSHAGHGVLKEQALVDLATGMPPLVD